MPRRTTLTSALVCAAALAAGCQPPRVDAASVETCRASLREVWESLSPEHAELFDSALRRTGLRRLRYGGVLTLPDEEGAEIHAVCLELDGLTGEEVLARP